jgi:hypothetical protein
MQLEKKCVPMEKRYPRKDTVFFSLLFGVSDYWKKEILGAAPAAPASGGAGHAVFLVKGVTICEDKGFSFLTFIAFDAEIRGCA